MIKITKSDTCTKYFTRLCCSTTCLTGFEMSDIAVTCPSKSINSGSKQHNVQVCTEVSEKNKTANYSALAKVGALHSKVQINLTADTTRVYHIIPNTNQKSTRQNAYLSKSPKIQSLKPYPGKIGLILKTLNMSPFCVHFYCFICFIFSCSLVFTAYHCVLLSL